MHCLLALVALIGAATLVPDGLAAPFVPASDDQVLERVPADRRAPTAVTDAESLPVALASARADAALARRIGDPRYLGRAEAALAPWWRAAEPPVAVLVLRATIRQSLHDFDGALADLAAVLARQPDNGEAWLIRAMIQQTRGAYPDALESCARLRDLAGRNREMRTAGTVCAHSVASFNGHAEESRLALVRLVLLADAGSPEMTRWAHAVLADIAVRLGRTDEARMSYEAALRFAPDDVNTRVAYADLLLELRSPEEALAVLRDDTRNDAVLLRIALAEHALGLPSAAERMAELRARFAAAALRGDVRELREEARFALVLARDPSAALAAARRNWAVQREPEDACILAAAANAAGDAPTVGAVRAWLRERAVEDVRLAWCLGQ